MAKRKPLPVKSRKTSTRSSSSEKSGMTAKTKKGPAKKSKVSTKKKSDIGKPSPKKTTIEKSSPTKRVHADSDSLKKKSKKSTSTKARKKSKATITRVTTKTTKKKATPSKTKAIAPRPSKARPRKVAQKKSPAKVGPRKVARKKSAATTKPRKVSRGKSAAEKSRVTRGKVAPKRKGKGKVQKPLTKAELKAQELLGKLRKTVAKQRAEQEAAVKWQRPKPPIRDVVKVPVKPTVRNRVYIIKTADSEGYREGKDPEKNRVRVSSHGNKKLIDFGAVLDGAFKAALRTTPFEDADEAPVTRYGIAFRVPDIINMELAKGAMREWFNTNLPPHASAHIVVEDSSISVHINFGKYDDYTVLSDAVKDLRKQKRLIIDAMDKTRDFTDYTDDYIWFAEWDWDDDITDY